MILSPSPMYYSSEVGEKAAGCQAARPPGYPAGVGMGAPCSSSVDWEAAYHRLLPRVYNFFLFRVGDRDLAEDLTATTFEKAWRACTLPTNRSPSAIISDTLA